MDVILFLGRGGGVDVFIYISNNNLQVENKEMNNLSLYIEVFFVSLVSLFS